MYSFKPPMVTSPPVLALGPTKTNLAWGATVSVATQTISHTVDQGTDMLVVAVVCFWGGVTTGRITGATWNGVDMYKDDWRFSFGGSISGDIAIFSLPYPQQGTFNVVVSTNIATGHLEGVECYNLIGVNRCRNYSDAQATATTSFSLPAMTVTAPAITIHAVCDIVASGAPTLSWDTGVVEDLEQNSTTRTVGFAHAFENAGLNAKAYTVTSSVTFNATGSGYVCVAFTFDSHRIMSRTLGATAVAGTTNTFSHTVETGTKKLVVIAHGITGTVSTGTVSGITYGGVSMTAVCTSQTSTGANSCVTAIYYLDNPTVGTANVVITYNVAMGTANGGEAYNVFGVGTGFDTQNTATGLAVASIAAAITTSAPALVIAGGTVSAASAGTIDWTTPSGPYDRDESAAGGKALGAVHWQEAGAQTKTYTMTPTMTPTMITMAIAAFT